MAANYITIGSRFTPFSYDELVRPLQEATQAHQAVQEAYDTYAENTGLIGAELDPTLDADIINNIYNPYNETLESAAMTLATQGLTPSARKSLSELRRRFGREITPIKLASDARKSARENWDRLSAADRSLMTNANPYYLGLTRYMNGRSPKTAYVSGNELYARGKEITQAMSQVMRNIPSNESMALQNQYWRIMQQKGFTSKEMNDFINGVIEDFPELNRQMNAILDASGIYDNDFSDQDIARAKQYIKDGMLAGMSGDTKVDYLQNRAWGIEAPEDPPVDSLYPPYYPTYTGGLDTSYDKILKKKQDPFDDVYYDKDTGELTTKEIQDIERSIESNPMRDLFNSDTSIIQEVEDRLGKYNKFGNFVSEDSAGNRKVIKKDEAEKIIGKEKLKEFNDAIIRRWSGGSNGLSDPVDQVNYGRMANDYRRFIKRGNDILQLTLPAKALSSDDADEIELKYNVKRMLKYEEIMTAIQNRGMTPPFSNSAQENAGKSYLINLAKAELGMGKTSVVSVLNDKGEEENLKDNEVYDLMDLLEDPDNFTISGQYGDSGGKVLFIAKEPDSKKIWRIMIHEDSLEAGLREANKKYQHLMDFSYDSIKNAQRVPGAESDYEGIEHDINWTKDADGLMTAVVKDPDSGEVYKYVRFMDPVTRRYVNKRTNIDDIINGAGLPINILQNDQSHLISNMVTVNPIR